MVRVPAAIGISALTLLASVLSACSFGGGYGGDAAANNGSLCQPGICAGSTGAASLPTSLREEY